MREEEMHQLIKDRIEGVLQGVEDRGVREHLAGCRRCQDTVEGMRRQAQLARLLRAPAGMEPAPGFYARVMNRIEASVRPSIWSLLLDPMFGRRLVLASLALVLVLGTYLATTDGGNAAVATVDSPEAILADYDTPPPLAGEPQLDRDTVLVNLATYQE